MLQNLLIENNFNMSPNNKFVALVKAMNFAPHYSMREWVSILLYRRLILMFLDKKEGKLILII